MNNLEIKARLLELPEMIREVKKTLFEKKIESIDIKEQLKIWELQEMANISNEVNEKGKPAYSNETKRQAELQRRKENSKEYQDLQNKLNKLDEEIAFMEIDLDKLYNEQGNLRAICRLEGRD